MTVYFSLRWRILVFTILPLLLLSVATLWMVDRTVTRQVRATIHESLVRSSLVLENVLVARLSNLATTAQVIVRDPRFASILVISGSSADSHYTSTVKKVARDFNSITTADCFDVLDRHGRLLASSGRATCSAAARDPLVRAALLGRQVSGILVVRQSLFQVTVTPVTSGRRVVGALLLGAEIGQPLARQLERTTHSQVTFASGDRISGSSFDDAVERRALIAILRARPSPAADPGLAAAHRVTERSRADRERDAARAGERLEVIEARGAAQEYLTLIRRIPRSAAEARQVYVMQRSLDAETAFLRDIQDGLLRLGIVAAVAALLAGVMLSASITRPVRRLVRGAEEMERGNYEYPLGASARDEIGYLSKRFQEMRQHERAYVSRLQEAARVKSEFISVASHELRTPIAVIKGYSELLAQGHFGPVSEAQRGALGAIAENIVRLIRLADDSTRMAELDSGPPTLDWAEHDVVEILEDAVAFGTAGACDRRVEVALDLEPDLGSVSADGPRVAQAVAALIHNGIRFTPDGGHVRVRGRRERDELVIEVADDGIGIAEERQRDLIQRPFVMSDSLHHHSSSTLAFNSGGLGLGLPIARGIVEAHGGQLLVESRPQRGSTFTIRLPLASPQDLSAAA